MEGLLAGAWIEAAAAAAAYLATGGFISSGRDVVEFTEDETRALRHAYILRLAYGLLFGDLGVFNTASHEEQEEARAMCGEIGVRYEEEYYEEEASGAYR